jgi:hypothetical protein
MTQLILKALNERTAEIVWRSEDSAENYDSQDDVYAFDSDDEAEEGNRNDDIIRMIEGDR